VYVIVPDVLRDAINQKLDEAYALTPDAAGDRESHFTVLLSHFNIHGILPDFTLQKGTANDR
jgi:hypothetical protein